MHTSFDVGPMTITYDSSERRRGETPDGAEQTGDVHLFHAVDDEHDAAMTLGYVDWAGAERHVELVDIEQGPTELHHLQGRRRLTIRPDADREYVELRQLRIQTEGPAPWSTLRKASEEELDEGAAVHVDDVLRDLGAHAVGARAELLDQGSLNRGSYLCATFEPGDRAVPVAAFALTRVLPALTGVEDQ